MNFDVQVVHGVSELGQAAWNKSSGKQPFSSYQWYQFGEATMTGCLPINIIISKEGQTVGRATFWVIRNEPLPIPWRPVRYLFETLLHHRPLLVCRSPLANVSGLILRDLPLREAALATIMQVAMEQAHHHQCSFVLFDHLERQAIEDNVWPADSVRYSIADPGSLLEIAWPDFESYETSLSPKTRKNYRRYSRYAEQKGIIIRYHESGARLKEASELITNVDKRYQQASNPWYARMLNHFSMVGGTMLTVEMQNRLIGCELLLGDGDEQLVTALGLDYTVPNVYFLLNYADIRCAIERGTRKLHWGSGAFEVKKRLGFQPEYNNHIVYCGVGKVARFIGRLAARFS